MVGFDSFDRLAPLCFLIHAMLKFQKFGAKQVATSEEAKTLLLFELPLESGSRSYSNSSQIVYFDS